MPWPKGRKHTPEELEKIRRASLGRKLGPLSQEHKEKMSASLRGKSASPIARESRAEGIRRAYREKPEYAQNISKALKGRKQSPEHLAKLSATRRGRALSEEHRHKLSLSLKGRSHTLEHNQNVSAGRRSNPPTQKFIDSIKAWWARATPDERARRTKNKRISKLEMSTWPVLIELGYEIQPQAFIDKYCVDILIPDLCLVIEIDGDYWHALPGHVEADALRDAYLNQAGFSVLRLRECDLREDLTGTIQRALLSLDIGSTLPRCSARQRG